MARPAASGGHRRAASATAILLLAFATLLTPALAQGGACGAAAGGASCTNGQCCSQHGFCGDTSDHCGTGCQASYGACSSSGGGSGGGSGGSTAGFSFSANVNTPSGMTSVSLLATSLLGGRAGQFLGSIPSYHVNQVCDALTRLGAQITIAADLTAHGSTRTYRFQVAAIGGCGASSAAPAGVQALLSLTDGRQMAVLCGNYVNGGLDASTPVDSCNIYLTGSEVERLHQALMSGSTSNRRLQAQQRRLRQTNCAACISNCYCTNVNDNCFPSDAQVDVEGVGALRMDQLHAGHKVLTMDASGRQAYEEVVFFGHRDAASPALVLALTVRGEGAAANTTRTLRLTSKHYLPTLVAGGRQLHKYARDVALGDRLLMLGVNGDSVVGQVVDKEWQAADGLFNPYTTGGFLVVDGVLASAHSDWVLDAIAPAALRHLLPHAYQVAFKPITWLYHLLGPRRLERLTDAAVPVLLANTAALAAAIQLALATGALGVCLGASVWASKPLRARK